MSVSTYGRTTHWRILASRLRAHWAGPRAKLISEALVMAACALLFLNAAATVEVVYTFRLSYILLTLACIVGAPFVILGWRTLPIAWRVTAGLLVLCYVLAAITGAGGTVADQARAGSGRTLVYFGDLLLGLAVIGLMSGLFPGGRGIRRPLAALAGGGIVAALYVIYQWAALHFGWPFANVNNALNPDAVTHGEVFQGNGLLFGWARPRGTFTEPLFLGLYLAIVLPLFAVWLGIARRGARAWMLGGGLTAIAFLLASSFPSWAIVAVSLMLGLVLFTIAKGNVAAASLAGGTLALLIVGVVIALGSPGVFSSITGRGKSDLNNTFASRVISWDDSLHVWTTRPVFGHGPGQTGVQLAHKLDPAIINRPSAPVVLGSSQGILTAALVDVGLVGALAWVAFLTACLRPVLRALVRSPSPLSLALAVASLAAVGGGLVSGDRLEIQIWLVLGLALAVSAGAWTAKHRPARSP
jgi:hypothetical protein